jgi:hypothetical protein
MIIMGKDKKRAGMVSMIMEKMKKGSKYDEMKEENEQMTHSKYKEGAEQDNKSAMDECCSQVMSALESKDAAKFKSEMRNMIKMIMSENESEDED